MSKLTTYYIYHIPNVKWGCTTNLKDKLRRDGYKESDVSEIIEVYDIVSATLLELQLNEKHHYTFKYKTKE